VITGSYNFTASAEKRNDENLLIFYSSDLASIFMQEFQRVFGEAQ
jgi:phosphatidylserine/phosphatidylglycerophosphate/cardiolipin synthase-like enzyme